jgi:hypothetical protein
MPRIQQIIAINDSSAEVFINDLGISIPISSQRDLFIEFDLEELDKSADLKTVVSAGSITINDGDRNLAIDEALSHLKIESEWSDYEDEGIEILYDGVPTGEKTRVVNFVGDIFKGVYRDTTTGNVDVELKDFIDSTSASNLIVSDNGVPITNKTVGINFVGAGAITYDEDGGVNVNVSTLEFIVLQNTSIVGVNTVTPTAIPFENHIYIDESFIHDSTALSRVYVSRAGTYSIQAQMNLINLVATHGVVRFRIRVNGNEYLDYATSYIYCRKKGSAERSTGAIFVTRSLLEGDYVEIISDQSGFTGDVNTIPNESTMTISFIRSDE